MEADLVAMVSDGSAATLRQHREARTGGPVRTTPVRLTGRGRLVATGVSALVIGLLSVTLATTAQATHGKHGETGTYDRNLATVTVAPGDSLWSVAEASDPGADPRLVIERIRQLNALTGDQLRPGEVLWVPRG